MKNIIVFSDGTGQEGGKGHNTNVYKLFNMVVDRDDRRQVAFYDRGLGTTAGERFMGQAFGTGISRNIKDCYQFLFQNYNAGDRIFLFGFSRGATTVRSLAGFIHHFGILPECRPELIDQAYRIYQIDNPQRRLRKAREFIARHRTMWARIRFLGVWDTVAALGVPHPRWSALINKIPFWKHKFHHLGLSESVEHARHALAIDDRRKVFHPTLWDEELLPYQTMKQVWFSGMHTDVGGGYAEQGLSDVVLDWMIGEARPHGLLIYDKHKVEIRPDPCGKMHDSRDTRVKRWLFKERERFWDHEKRGKPVVHESVLIRHKALDDYRPWILRKEYAVEK